MKRLNGWSLGAAIMLFALASCTNEALLPEAPQVDEPNDPNACQLVGDNFLWEGEETRTSLTIEDNMAKFCWTAGDRVGILPDEGAQVFFTIPEPEEGGEMTNTATFDGGAWALKAESNYAAYYPFVKDFDLDRTEVPVNYKGQKQNGTSTAHLGAYDFQGARPVMTNENGGGVTFDFDHVGALVLLKFTVPDANTALKSVTLSAEDESFITEGTYNLTSSKDDGFPITETETSESLTVEVDYTTTTDNEEVTVYFMCAPIDLSGKMVNVSIAYGDADESFDFVAVGKNMVAGNGYALTAMSIEMLPYLTFSAAGAQTMVISTVDDYVLDESLQYSVGDGAWTKLTAGKEINFGGQGKDLRLRGQSSTGTAVDSYPNFYTITFLNEVPVACTGDIRTLVDYLNYSNASMVDARFCNLFSGCIQLTSAPELPATTLAEGCYDGMFSRCISLTEAPELPAETLAEYCYSSMFSGCVGLAQAPELPAETLAAGCYSGMFSRCEGLTKAPELPATTLAEGCYSGMFSDCSALTEAPALPAETLAEYCYSGMFSGCVGLTEAPELSATILAEGCYSGMFSGCSALTEAPALPATTLAEGCYERMFSNCKGLVTVSTMVLPATTLVESCYSSMFNRCTNLTTAPALPATTLAASCYSGMFQECKGLTEAPALPAEALAESCYSSMFAGCTSLTTAPALPAETLAADCYSNMFENCKVLTQAPVLPAKTLAASCYSSMFKYCEVLAQAPALPAMTLAEGCYSGMFDECTGLTQAPALPAMALAVDCYENMFIGCTNLTTAPELHAKTLSAGCYSGMFRSCKNLKNVTMLATDISAESCLSYWLYDVANEGTFTKAAEMKSLPSGDGDASIPSGWIVQNYTE